MVKLIISDMDGTLLNDKKEIDPEIYTLLPKLQEKGVRFMVASGRQYPSLLSLFHAHQQDVVMIAENGAFVVQDGKELYESPMDWELIRLCLAEIAKTPQAEPLLCGKYCSYTTSPEIRDVLQSEKFRYRIELVENLYQITEPIVKLSVMDYCIDGAEKNSFTHLLPRLGDKTTMAVSGFACLDLMNPGVSKGSAIAVLQEEWGIPKEETAAFGDHFNDIEMFSQAGYSYAMEHAAQGVKRYARFQTGSNNTGSVVREIRRLVGI